MIKTLITAGANERAGELLRLLVHHPEVEIAGVVDPTVATRRVDDVHHGLIGDIENLHFMADIPSDKKIDVVFCFGGRPKGLGDSVKYIYLSPEAYETYPEPPLPPALSEIYRKVLVRGARECLVLSPVETAGMIALYPLARNLLLRSSLTMDVSLARKETARRSACVMQYLLGRIQQSFDGEIEVRLHQTVPERRAVILTATIDCPLSLADLQRLYEELYDDHNFTWLIGRLPEARDVEGTHKCLIHLERDCQGKTCITAAVDGYLRGGAGEAVHAMNLMFGLYEKVGLQLKASMT